MSKDVRSKNGGQTKLKQKIQALDYHNYQLSLNPKHKQSDTIEFFRELDEFPISKSSFNRWILDEKNLRDEFNKISNQMQDQERRRLTKHKTVSAEFKQFMKKNYQIIRCMELYFQQNYLILSEGDLKKADLVEAFNKFKTIIQTDNQEELKSSLIWSSYNWITGKISNIRGNLEELKRIESATSSLIGEKSRIYQELQLYLYDNVYYFNEIIIDLENLYELTNFENEIFLGEESFRNKEQDLLTGSIRQHKTVTLSLCGNLNGTNFLPLLFISNFLNENISYLNDENSSNKAGAFYYHPEGLNSHEILQDYFQRLNTKLLAEKRRIKIIFDNYRCHLELCLNFSNIEFVLINSKYDRTMSSFSSSTLVLPYDNGLERLLRFKLKSKLFKFFYKNRREQLANQFIEKNGDIIHSIFKCHYEAIVGRFADDPSYRKFYELNITSSKLFSVPSDLYDDSVETRSKFKIEKGYKLGTFIHSKIGKDFLNILKYNDKSNILYLKDDEEELNKFVKDIAANIMESNDASSELSSATLCKNILQEFTAGRNEVKGNKQYSDEAISELVEKFIQFENRNQIRKTEDKKITDIDVNLLEIIQPFLIKNLSSNSSFHTSEQDEPSLPRISLQTLDLFTKFYDSYVNDTTILHPAGKEDISLVLERPEREIDKVQEIDQEIDQEADQEIEPNIDPTIAKSSPNTSKEGIDSSEIIDQLDSPTVSRHNKRPIKVQSLNRPKIMKLFSKKDKDTTQKNFKSTFSDDSGDDSET